MPTKIIEWGPAQHENSHEAVEVANALILDQRDPDAERPDDN
ncbi:hypothetical protein [Nocardioides sp.]